MNQVKDTVQDNSGWSVHIYQGRRLLFSLYPSHAWIFLLGAVSSSLLIFAGLQWSNCVSQPSKPGSAQPAQVAPLQLD
ncbi:hypothetical protein C1752_04536 [Acaryochloris thomasi RCC1774]|uniref:Uncharacterized protein n=1 Tax=Acaryochloris thomasi RCC1774 TaxID=1764569 RepID=A0A2W1JK40_9CYAN|nr:hypothetical protein [Acaryochloris thomasi]PZD71845.1 hypothetical protein C1752_04536 [Acaryochloris thomasi RCC1774]